MEDLTVGTRVSVGSGDGTKDLGLGTYVGSADMHWALIQDRSDVFMLSADSEDKLNKLVEKAVKPRKPVKGVTAKVVSRGKAPTPKIQLDGGRVIYGSQCWWEPVQEH